MTEIITTFAIISATAIFIEKMSTSSDRIETLAIEDRPESFTDADTYLAAHGYGRVQPWDLNNQGTVTAKVEPVDNLFNGTRAARLWEAVGTTHEEWDVALAGEVNDGDLISDMEISEPYVVAGSRHELDTMRIHMVRDGGTWESRYTTDFNIDTLVQVARRKA
jgi:hypothetical protein